MVLALCRRMVGPALAEDAAQEAVLAAMLHLDRLRQPERFGPWLAGIGLNVCRLWLREQARRRIPTPAPGAAPRPDAGVPWPAPELAAGSDPAALVAAADVAARVRAAVAALPPGQRAAVWLYYLAGMTQGEVAEALGVEPGAVRVRLHAARRALRRPLEKLWMEETLVTPASDQPVEVVVDGVRLNLQTHQRWVILAEKGGDRLLSIGVGNYEADALVIHMEQLAIPRPQPHDLTVTLLRAAGTRVREAVVERLSDDVFYATLAIDGPGGPAAVDARPSDALNLALRDGAPIKVRPELFAIEGKTRADLAKDDARRAEENAASEATLVEKLTPRARRIVTLARDEVAPRFRYRWVGPETVLLAMLEDGEGVGASVLTGLGVTAERFASRFPSSRRPEAPAQVTTWAALRLLQQGAAEAAQLGHDAIGTGHLLLGLVQNSDAWGIRMLGELGVDLQAVRASVVAELARPSAEKAEKLPRTRRRKD